MNYRGARDEVSFGILFLAIFWFEVLQYNPTTDKWSQIGKVKRGTLYGHAIIEANLRAVCPVGNEKKKVQQKSMQNKYPKQAKEMIDKQYLDWSNSLNRKGSLKPLFFFFFFLFFFYFFFVFFIC